MNLILLTILLFISDIIELTYDMGKATRTHVLPAIVYVYVRGLMMYEQVTTFEMDMPPYKLAHKPLSWA